MLRKSNFILFFFLGVFILSLPGCFHPPDKLSDIPKISYKSLVFKEVDGGADSLILKFNVEDGDGDIGLTSDDTNPPYQSFDLVLDSAGYIVTISDTSLILPFYTYDFDQFTFFSDTDSRPAYNCTDYYIVDGDNPAFPFTDPRLSGYYGDTVFIQPNEYHTNLHLIFLYKDLTSGEFLELNFAEYYHSTACGIVTLDGRIPIFDQDLIGEPLQGVFSYNMLSAAFRDPLSSYTFKIRFYLYDQALHQSNIVETPEFNLADITKN